MKHQSIFALIFMILCGINVSADTADEQKNLFEYLMKVINAEKLSPADLRGQVNNVTLRCRTLLSYVDNKSATLWEPKLGLLEISKKKKLAEIKKTMSFEKYLDTINSVKTIIGTTKATLLKKIDDWATANGSADPHQLNMDISLRLNDFAQSGCGVPYRLLKNTVEQLESLQK